MNEWQEKSLLFQNNKLCSPIAIWTSLTTAFRCSLSALFSSSWTWLSSCSSGTEKSQTESESEAVSSVLLGGWTQSIWVTNCSRSSNEFSRSIVPCSLGSSASSSSYLGMRLWEREGEIKESVLKLFTLWVLHAVLTGLFGVSVWFRTCHH